MRKYKISMMPLSDHRRTLACFFARRLWLLRPIGRSSFDLSAWPSVKAAGANVTHCYGQPGGPLASVTAQKLLDALAAGFAKKLSRRAVFDHHPVLHEHHAVGRFAGKSQFMGHH